MVIVVRFIIFVLLFASTSEASWLYLNFNDDKTTQPNAHQEITVLRQFLGDETLIVLPGPQDWLQAQNLATNLSELQRKREPISTVVISGHHSRLSFAGKTGSLTSLEIKSVFLDPLIQNLRNSISAIYLLGCYTLNPLALDFWLGAFPNLKYGFGFHDLSPLNYTVKNSGTLKSFLSYHTKNIVDSVDGNTKNLTETLKTLNTYKVPVTIFFNPKNPSFLSFESPRKVIVKNLAKMKSSCHSSQQVLEQLRETFECYLRATDECRDVPKSTSNSPLRKAYSEFADLSHCLADDSTMLESEEVIRLIYFHKILAHYRKVFKNELAKVRTTAIQINPKTGTADTAFLIKAQTRKDWLDGMENLMQNYSSFDAQNFMEKFFRSAEHYLYRPSPYCIPLGWVDDNPKEAPLCGFDPADKKYL